MKNRSYSEGIVIGLFLGVAGALLLPRLFPAGRSTGAAAPVDNWSDPEPRPDFVSRREQPEAAGDPTQATGATLARRGGAPGPGRKGEQMQMPGRPGQVVDTGGSQKVAVSNRALPIRKTAGPRSRTKAIQPGENPSEGKA